MAMCNSSFGLGAYGSPPFDNVNAGNVMTGTAAVHLGATRCDMKFAVDYQPQASNCKNCAASLNWLARACEYCGTFFR